MSLKSLFRPSHASALHSVIKNLQNPAGKLHNSVRAAASAGVQANEVDKRRVAEFNDSEPPDDGATPAQFNGSNFDFPCLNRRFIDGPEPAYQKVVGGYKRFAHKQSFHMYYNEGVLPEVEVAYETWGELNSSATNAVLIFTGLSGSSHACSHEGNTAPGWWEKFIGPGRALDTDKFFVVCANLLGGCYGSTRFLEKFTCKKLQNGDDLLEASTQFNELYQPECGPSSINPLTGKQYATSFPMVSVKDMVEVQKLLLESLGITKLYAAVGASLGGMCSVAMASLYPSMVPRLVSLSASSKAHPTGIAFRYLQRRCIMEDPVWNRGYYYDGEYPLRGTKLAREIATMTYRSGVEWEKRFGRAMLPDEQASLCQNFEIEQYIEYQGLQYANKLDANTLLYLSKALDLFDVNDYFENGNALSRIKCPTLVMGITTDMLFPVQQQRDLAEELKRSGNQSVTYYELNSIYGHDTFLLDLSNIGTALKGFLETNMSVNGNLAKHSAP